MTKHLTSTKDLKRVLGFWDLMGIAVGSIIGSGVMSLTGVGIGMTGRSIPLAFILGGIISLITRAPQIFLNSVARFRGGQYSMIGTYLGERWTGTFSMISILTSVTLSMYALSFADYAMPFLPMMSRKLIAIGILTLLFIINSFGIEAFSKFQNLAVGLLVISLTIFSVFGITRLDANYLAKESFMTGGIMGFWRAAVLMSLACDGAQTITDLGGEAKNPTKDIPRVMILSTMGVSVAYGFIGVVAAGVLPIDKVAYEPLTVVASQILPKSLYLVFVIGGAWMALITTLNSQIASCTKPLMQACNDGWYPKSLARLHPKYRTPLILLGMYYIIGFFPIVFDFDIGAIGNLTITVASITKAMIVLCLLRLPKVMAVPWKKSAFYISDGKLKIVGFIVLGTVVFSGITSSLDLPLPLLLANLAVVVFAFAFGRIRYNSGKVNVEASYEIES
ncbi:MAG: amino acid permease [Tissierellia bacterium]|nr:amino acid permease [Tissierellia bacterium]